MLRLRSVTKRVGPTTLVEDVSLGVEPRRTTVLIGPSGSGKSSLLRLMLGLIGPTEGTVEFDGAPLDHRTIRAVRRRVGYVIQDGGLFPHLTARRNVTLLPAHLGWDESRQRERVEELAALTHFPADGLDRYPLELSGGQRQRVALMRALALDPDVLLMDEPLGALDPMIRADLQRELRELFRRLGKTVVLVTHDMEEAGYLGDRVVLMWEGRVLQEGAFGDLVERPGTEDVSRFVAAQRSKLVGWGADAGAEGERT